MRILFFVILLLHAAIHLLGFARFLSPASITGMSGETLFSWPLGGERTAGWFWLVAALLLAAAAGLFIGKISWWWLVGLVGLLLSQLLVIHAWPDAKAGSVPNLLLLVAIVLAGAASRFESETDRTVNAMYASGAAASSSSASSDGATEESIAALPPPVQRWLRHSGALERPIPRGVFLTQSGQLRTDPKGAFMPAEAEQYFRTDEPGFVWQVHVTMARVVPILGRDSYLDGRGRMLIRAGGLVSMVDAQGPEIDQGTLLRYLGEIVWFPGAALRPYLAWRAIDDHKAEATMTHRGVSALAILEFDAEGRMNEMTAQRFLGAGAEAKLTDWVVTVNQWGRFEGVLIPTRGEVSWEMESGRFTYYLWEIKHLEYDPAAMDARSTDSGS